MLKKIVRVTGLILVFAILTGCATNPVTGEKEFMLLSEEGESRLGAQTDLGVTAQYGLYDDPALTQYITDIGTKLDQYSHRPDLPYVYKVMDSEVINAFAVPGGYVYVTRGILAYLNNEAELAGVLGHEIGHVAARHSAQQYSKTQLAQVALGVGSLLSETFREFAGIAQAGVQMLFLKFSRENEKQSDTLGVEYSTLAGYDAREMANFFVTLGRLNPSDGSHLPALFSTHPDPPGRVEAIQEQAERKQANVGGTGAVGRERYLSMIDGMLFGPDPREGYTYEGMFYHPGLTFQLPVPSGWQVINSKTQLQLVEPGGKAAVLLSLSNAGSIDRAATDFASASGAAIEASQSVSVGGYPAHRVSSVLQTSQGFLSVLSYFIEKEGLIYTLHGLTATDTSALYAGTLEMTMTGFSKLTSKRRIDVTPSRIAVKTATRTGTADRILSDLGVDQRYLEQHAMLNGIVLADTVEAGTLLKIVVPGNQVSPW